MNTTSNISILELPEELIENIIWYIFEELYEKITDMEYQNVFNIIKKIFVYRTYCTVFKRIIKKLVNYDIGILNENILMWIYQQNMTINDLQTITKYMYCMGLDMNQQTIQNNNLLLYIIDNHYSYENFYVGYDNNYELILETLLKLNVNPNNLCYDNNSAMYYHLRNLYFDELYDNICNNFRSKTLKVLNIYIDNENSHGLKLHDINENMKTNEQCVWNMIVNLFTAMIDFTDNPQPLYTEMYNILKKLEDKNYINIENIINNEIENGIIKRIVSSQS